jgi:hypothetical protein
MIGMAMRLAAGMGDAVRQAGPAEDPLCEFCGYNLHATPFDSRCPECGEPASHSLLPTRRCNDWEVGRLGYWRSLGHLMNDPTKFFRTIRTREQFTVARRFLVLSTAVSSLLFACVLVAGAPIRDYSVWPHPALRLALTNASYGILRAGVWAMAAPIVCMFVASLLAGASRSRRDKLDGRGAMKIACYLSALAIPWAVLMSAVITVLSYLESTAFRGRAYDRLATLVWPCVGVLLLVSIWIAASRGYDACRSANT